MGRSTVVFFALVATIGCDGQGAAPDKGTGATADVAKNVSKVAQTETPARKDPFYAESDGPISPRPKPIGDSRPWNFSPEAEPTLRFVKFCETNGLKLRHQGQGYNDGYWLVVAPQVRDCSLRVRIRAFPDDFTAEQMRWVMMDINLAFGLNSRARIAMSPPELAWWGLPPEKVSEIQSSDEYRNLVERLKKLFIQFTPDQPTGNEK